MKECDTQISCIVKEQKKLEHKMGEAKLERKKLENEVSILSSLRRLMPFVVDLQ